ncbi:MAG: hypothetical protein UCH28_07555 [Adlercreutzia sp.]|nr:hypothetical protein [Adlercreutzia sp.]
MEDKISCANEASNDKCASMHTTITKCRDIQILKTDADRIGKDLAVMSDYLSEGLQALNEVHMTPSKLPLEELPIATLSSIKDAVAFGEMFVSDSFSLVPDFDSLPCDVKGKLKQGIYTIADSKQVDGNVRAVILDENGVRVKDITLKQVKSKTGNDIASRDLLMQIQMQRMSSMLENLTEMQTYQIKRDRDKDIRLPFLKARDLLVEAEAEVDPSEQERMLKEARRIFSSVSNALYADLERSSALLAQRASHYIPIIDKRVNVFLNPKRIREAMDFVVEDLQSLQKATGIQLQIDNVLGDADAADRLLRQYINTLVEICENPLDSTGRSTAQIIHAHFPYTSATNNTWHKLAKTVVEAHEKLKLLPEKSELYLIEIEDANEKPNA